jgi:hypothetical protein
MNDAWRIDDGNAHLRKTLWANLFVSVGQIRGTFVTGDKRSFIEGCDSEHGKNSASRG